MSIIKVSYKGDQDAHWGAWKGARMNDRDRLRVFSPGRGDRNLEIASSDFPIRLMSEQGVRVAFDDEAITLFEIEGQTYVADALRQAGARSV